jgi:hypothetical protein
MLATNSSQNPESGTSGHRDNQRGHPQTGQRRYRQAPVRGRCDRPPGRDVPGRLRRFTRHSLDANGSKRCTARRFGHPTRSLEDWADFHVAVWRIHVLDSVVKTKVEMQAV